MSDTNKKDNESAVKHVVIVGAGLVGLYCAKALASVANVELLIASSVHLGIIRIAVRRKSNAFLIEQQGRITTTICKRTS